MSSASTFAAQLLQRSQSAYASLAAARLLEEEPQLGEGMGPAPWETWKEHFEVRLEELAVALGEDRVETFVAQVHWSRAAWSARDVDPNGLRRGLEALHDTLTSELPPAAALSIEPYLRSALEGFDTSEVEASRFVRAEAPHGRLAAEYLKILFEGDAPAAEERVLRAVREDELSVQDAFRHVLEPALREIGLMWQLDEATVSDEHFATAVTRRLITRLGSQTPLCAPNGHTLLAASVSTEAHDVGLQLVAESFQLDGWRVINLGANVPTADVIASVGHYGAAILALSATLPTHRPEVARVIAALRQDQRFASVKVLVGGLAFVSGDESTWRETGADGFAEDAAGAVQLARSWVGLGESSAG